MSDAVQGDSHAPNNTAKTVHTRTSHKLEHMEGAVKRAQSLAQPGERTRRNYLIKDRT